jgi:hypothetical protein
MEQLRLGGQLARADNGPPGVADAVPAELAAGHRA